MAFNSLHVLLHKAVHRAQRKLHPAARSRPARACLADSALPQSLVQGNKLRKQDGSVDLVLSSGFLAFANHSGFIQAVEHAGLKVGGVMGTSAGALTGSLYCAGYTPKQVAEELARTPPYQLLLPSCRPWRGGVLSLRNVILRLRELLPPRFEDLDRDFAVGVVTADGGYVVVDSGPLAEAVAASAAIPFLFSAVTVPGVSERCIDGGVYDRVGLKAWRDRRRKQLLSMAQEDSALPHALVHVISRSSPFSGLDDVESTGEGDVTVVYSPRSGASLFDLGDYETQLEAAMARTSPALEQYKVRAGLQEGKALLMA